MTLIDPEGVPGAHLDLQAVRSGASGITGNGATIRDRGADVVRDWQQLPASFEATGTERLYAAMTPVGTTTSSIGDSLAAIGKALAAYADEVEPIKARLDSLRSQAVTFAAKANSFQSHTEWVSSGYTLWIPQPEQIDSWDQDPGMNDENNALIRQVAQAEADWLDAQQRCATAIRAAVGLGATGAAQEQALAKQLRSDGQLQTSWGSTSDRKESCSEKAATFPTHFLWDGVIVGFGWGTIKSLDTLSGMNPDALWKAGDGILHGDWGQVVEAGKEDLAATGQAWLGLSHLVSSVAIPIDPATRMSLLHSGAFDWLPADVRKGAEDWTAADGTALYGTVAGFVGLTLPTKWWDPKAYKADQVFKNWTENPGGAAGTSVANIGSFFIPGAGEARAGGVAADAAKVAEGTRVADMVADGSIGSLRGLSADALQTTIKGLTDADAARLATELAKPELDAGALSGLKLDDLTIHEAPSDAPAVGDAATDRVPGGPAHESPTPHDPADPAGAGERRDAGRRDVGSVGPEGTGGERAAAPDRLERDRAGADPARAVVGADAPEHASVPSTSADHAAAAHGPADTSAPTEIPKSGAAASHEPPSGQHPGAGTAPPAGAAAHDAASPHDAPPAHDEGSAAHHGAAGEQHDAAGQDAPAGDHAAGGHDGRSDGGTADQHGGDHGTDGSATAGDHVDPDEVRRQIDEAQREVEAGATVTFDSSPAGNAAAEHYGAAEWNDYADHLPQPEKDALLTYTKEESPAARAADPSVFDYREINGALRGDATLAARPDVAQAIERIDQALEGHPLPESTVVTRGTDVGHWGFDPADGVGRELPESAYVSTSLGGIAPGFEAKAAVLHLQIPAGMPAIWVERVGAFGGGERELLLGRGFTWRIDRVVWDGSHWQVYGRVKP